MHIISSFALSIMSAKTDDDFKKKDIVPAISLFFMYCAFYLDPKLEHLAFQPWWCVSLIGLRYSILLQDKSLETIDNFKEKIESVTYEEVREALKSELHVDQMKRVCVGTFF